MDEHDPETAASLEDLAACLRHVHLRADRPTYRALELQTALDGGFLPGTRPRLRKVRLTRTTVSDVLAGRKFPGKAFLLTFVDACGIDIETDRRWEQAWDRLAAQYQQVSAAGEAEKLRQENEELRRQLTEARDRANTDRELVRAAEAHKTSAAHELEKLRKQLAATHKAETVERHASREQASAQAAGSRLDAAIRRATIAEKLLEWERKLSGSGFVSVIMPQLGEGVTESTVTRWLKKEGERVEVSEPLLEVSNGGGHTALLTPVTGTVRAAASFLAGKTAAVGTVLAVIDKARDEANDESPGRSVSVSMPQLGERVTEGIVTRWLKKEGERVEVDEPLLEVSTNKVDTDIPSPATGILRGIAVDEDETVAVGAQLAVIEPAPYRAISTLSVSMPQLHESVTEGTVVRWLKKEGERVEVDEPLLEVSTDKLDTDIPSPATGILRGIAVDEDQTVTVGAQLAVIEPALYRAITRQSCTWPVRMPLVNGVTQGTVTRWLKKEGERAEANEPLIEIATDWIDFKIPSPSAGILRSIAVNEDNTVAVGKQLAVIEETSPRASINVSADEITV